VGKEKLMKGLTAIDIDVAVFNFFNMIYLLKLAPKSLATKTDVRVATITMRSINLLFLMKGFS
jgi:hypothetical protein